MWEYRVEQVDMQAPFGNAFGFKRADQTSEAMLIYQLGAEGWDLVNAVPLQATTGITRCIRLYFKRWRPIQPA
jgi:hypothetical protein